MMSWRNLKGLLAVYAWMVFGLVMVYAFAQGLSRWGDEEPMHSGARPDSRLYVAVDPSSRGYAEAGPSSSEAVTSSGYAEANALRSFGHSE